MVTKVTATELARNLSDILNRVRYQREQFVVERNGEEVATLTPIDILSGATLRDLVIRLGDVALPGDGFADDLEQIQAAQTLAEPSEWPS